MVNNIKLNNVHYYIRLSSWWNGPLINVVDPEVTTNIVGNSDDTTKSDGPEKSDFSDVLSKLYNFFFELK